MTDAGGTADGGSFRDYSNRVYRVGDRILRAVDKDAGSTLSRLTESPLAASLIESGDLLPMHEVVDTAARRLVETGWARVFEHPRIPLISYPYEWSFSMLKDAALLHLRLVEKALEDGWTLKDASPYNIQWIGSRPIFIDAGSFEPWVEGQPWVGYRQFCSLFLIPLMMKAHLGIDPRPILRSQLDGIPPIEARRYFRGLDRFKAGVMSHVVFPAAVEAAIVRKERDRAPAQKRAAARHSKAMVIGLVQGLSSLVRRLRSRIEHTDWSYYAVNNSYEEADLAQKLEFVRTCLAEGRHRMVWDIGCNTGAFSRAAAEFADYVVAADRDSDSIEQLYLAERASGGEKILPLVLDVANISPGQGWAGKERQAFDRRGEPDLVLCLALVHHIRVSANIPLLMFLDWLRSLDAQIIIEFVDRGDDMFVKLLTNKTVNYPDYSLASFEAAVAERFTVKSRQKLKQGTREIFHLVPA